MELRQVCLRRGEERDLRRGKRRVYDNEAAWIDEGCTDGEVVDVVDGKGNFVARGFLNSRSKILVRILTQDPNEVIDSDFFARRLARAWTYRKALGFSQTCRVVFGESDGLPGLTVDKFGDYLSLQIVSLGMEAWKPVLVECLAELFSPLGIYERNDLSVREKEGPPSKHRMPVRQGSGACFLPGARRPNAGRSTPRPKNRAFSGPAGKSRPHPALLRRCAGSGPVLPYGRLLHSRRTIWRQIRGVCRCLPRRPGYADSKRREQRRSAKNYPPLRKCF